MGQNLSSSRYYTHGAGGPKKNESTPSSAFYELSAWAAINTRL